jgi:carboxyl-terminal processing protease
MAARRGVATDCALAWCLVTLLALAGCGAARTSPAADPSRDLRQILDLVSQKYVRDVPDGRLVAAARDAMLAALDPYSSHLDAATYADLKASLASRFGGIGIRLDFDPAFTAYRVRAALEGSPALAAGMRPGDRLEAIDGRNPSGHPDAEVVGWLRGQAGTTVDLVVRRAGVTDPLRLRLTRTTIETRSVRGARRDASGAWAFRLPTADDIAYLRVMYFARDTAAEVRRALTAIEAASPRGLVIDLRRSPGGSFTAATETADLFLDRGRIVSVRSRIEGDEAVEATPGTATSLPVAVLVDEKTMSAAEVVAAGLQDNGRAIVVGARTYGKATVQQLFPLASGDGAVRITVAHWLRPSGQPLERHYPGSDDAAGGVRPDAGLAVTDAPADAEALGTWLDELDENAALIGLPPDHRPWPTDASLAAACAALRARRPAG